MKAKRCLICKKVVSNYFGYLIPGCQYYDFYMQSRIYICFRCNHRFKRSYKSIRMEQRFMNKLALLQLQGWTLPPIRGRNLK